MKSTVLLSRFLCTLSLLQAVAFGLTADAPLNNGSDDTVSYLLPETTEPVSYGLRIKPVIDLANDNYVFFGQVDIVIRAKNYTDEVILNSKDLNITSVSGLKDLKTKRTTAIADCVHDVGSEWLIVKLKKKIIPPRNYSFSIVFEGYLRNDFTGFHRYFYDFSNHTRWIALTQFKPIYARRTFPCYDEPKFKTPYKISIARQREQVALSNMPLDNSKLDQLSGYIWDSFETTKPIPTYLVAFMVSDFNKTSLSNDNIAIYTTKQFNHNITYMMEKVPNLLNAVENFTRIPYMLPKLDLVGVPFLDRYDLENWGLNAYKEFYFALSNNSQNEEKMLVTMTVLHEILHQWFGNLVTTPVWDYVWLYEGLCNYLKYWITDTMEPDWRTEETFIEDVHQRALAWDEYNYTRALTFSARTSNEIIDLFDCLTVDKSADLFRMLKHTVGEEHFKKSLSKYLEDFAYSGAGPKQLWETFDYVLYDADYTIEEDVTVNNSMYLWTEQAGYPLINITETDGSVIVTQERFSLSKLRETDDFKWYVGLTYTTEKTREFDRLTPTVWLKPQDDRKHIPLPADSGWFVFNLQSTGFYRVNYNEKNWKLLLIQLVTKPDQIHYLNRAQIIDDSHHLSRANLVPYSYYISLLQYLLMEDHVTPWNTATNGLSSILNGLRRYPAEYLKFEKYVKSLSAILYNKLANNKIGDGATKSGWNKLLTWSCKMGNSHCEKSALKHFEDWTNGRDLPSEMKEAAFCIGMRRGNLTSRSNMLNFYHRSRSTSCKRDALKALACIEDVPTLFNYLNHGVGSIHANRANTQNFKIVCESMATTAQGVHALAKLLAHRLDAFLALEDGPQLVRIACVALASKVSTDAEISTINEIRRNVKSADLRAVVDAMYRQIESNTKWIERDHGEIINALGQTGVV